MNDHKSQITNPTNFTQIFSNHDDYKKHLNNLFKIKGQVDSKAPARFKHLRPKTFKQELFDKRERQNENDHLVLKILKLRQQSPQMAPSSKFGAAKLKRCGSARSAGPKRNSQRLFNANDSSFFGANSSIQNDKRKKSRASSSHSNRSTTKDGRQHSVSSGSRKLMSSNFLAQNRMNKLVNIGNIQNGSKQQMHSINEHNAKYKTQCNSSIQNFQTSSCILDQPKSSLNISMRKREQ